MKKFNKILLALILCFLAGCTGQNEVQPKPQEPKATTENKVSVAPPKVSVPEKPKLPEETTETTPPKKLEEKQPEHKFKRVEVALSRPIDGDTIEVMYKGKAESVCFLLVDTPETHHPRLGKQPFGEEAKAFTAKMVQNAKKIELEFDIGPERDKYINHKII